MRLGRPGYTGRPVKKRNPLLTFSLCGPTPHDFPDCRRPSINKNLRFCAFDGRCGRRSRRHPPHSRRRCVRAVPFFCTRCADRQCRIIRRVRSVLVAPGSVAGDSQQRGALLASSAAERHESISCCDSCRRRRPPSPYQAEGQRRAATGRRRPAGSRGRAALSGRLNDVDVWSMCTGCVVD